jgi:glycosyltransferase involved in cell wall biosynthesis
VRFGIVTPTLDAERYCRQCLESIWAQASDDVRIDHVVVDGDSTDRTVEIAAGFPSRVVVARDGGMYEAVNRGMAMVEGDVVGYVNADDEVAPEALSVVARTFDRNPAASWLCGAVELIGADGGSLSILRMVPFSLKAFVGLGWSPIHSMTVWARREFFDRVGPFDTSFRQAGDYDWYARALSLERPLVVPEVLARFRLHPANLSLDRDRMARERDVIQGRYGGRKAMAVVRGRMLSLRLNMANPGWFASKRKGVLPQGRLPKKA